MYLGTKIYGTGRCATATAAKTRRELVKFRKCSKLLHGKRLSLMLSRTAYNKYVSQQFSINVEYGV